ncbi:PKD domain-containing protein [bacterium]|nr:PKD domain-containing protein [bacterium]
MRWPWNSQLLFWVGIFCLAACGGSAGSTPDCAKTTAALVDAGDNPVPARSAAVAYGPPDGPYNRITDLAGFVDTAGRPVLSWTERLAGDGNNDGLVTAADITPIGFNFNAVPTPGSPAADADYNNDGLVSVADITVLGQQWQASLAGYAVCSGPTAGGLSELARLERAAQFTAPAATDGQLQWSWTGEALAEPTAFRVQPYDAGDSLGLASEDAITLDPAQAGNIPPQITLGPAADPSPLTLPATAELSVAAQDLDGGPAPLTYFWELVDGPAAVGFSDNGTATASTTTATFTADGSYQLHVTVSDGEDTASGDLALAVDPPGGVDALIPAEYRVDWQPGIPGGIPDYPAGISVTDYGAVGDGSTDDTQAFLDAIDAAQEGTALIIPAGTYYLNGTLQIMKGICLRGAGYQSTVLEFHNDGDCIEIKGWWPNNWLPVTSGYVKGSTELTVEDASEIEAGDIIEIQQENDYNVYHTGEGTGWLAESAVGQLLPVTAVNGNTLTLGRPLHYSYNPACNPVYAHRTVVTGVGVEDLTIDRLTAVTSYNNIELTSVAYCWVRNVMSKMCGTAHVGVSRSLACEIRRCGFDNAWVDGGGGQGYGTSVGTHATDNLVEDNIFRQLRHSMTIQVGACGNVMGYNYSTEPDRSDVCPGWPSPCICIHGHYGHRNLFEGNVVQLASIDNWWGTNGPTTLFRNRVEHLLKPGDTANYCLSIQENNPRMNIIGNELGTADPASEANNPLSINEDAMTTIILHGNYVYQDGSLQWDPAIANHNLPASLYHETKPEFFGTAAWPPIGGDIAPTTTTIPAQLRFNSGEWIPSG